MNWKTACKIVAPAAACAGAFAFLVAPGRATRAQKAPFLYRNYAHRGLHTEDADSDLLLEADCAPMTEADYAAAKLLVLKSARDFCTLFESIPNPDISPRAPRTSFYGPVPRTPREMYDHTNSTTAYYMAAFGIPFENMPDLYANRLQALAEIEEREELLTGKVCTAPDGERWTLRKLLRRFLWHDRIHARAMWRMAAPLWGSAVADPFGFR